MDYLSQENKVNREPQAVQVNGIAFITKSQTAIDKDYHHMGSMYVTKGPFYK